MPQQTIYFKERTVRGSEIVEAGFPVSVDAEEAAALLEEGMASSEPPEVTETHITYDTVEVPVERGQAQAEGPSPYDHLVSGVPEASATVEEVDHTDQEPPVITGETVARTATGVAEDTPPAPPSSGPGTRRLPPEPEARVQLLKGKALNAALRSRGMVVGQDTAEEKRVRLLADFQEKGDTEKGIKSVILKALEDA